MKILKKIKGFVTNSSSANYWLIAGLLDEDNLPEIPPSVDVYRTEYYEKKAEEQKTYDKANEKKEFVSDLILWTVFSLVLVIVYLLKKFKNDKSS